MSIRDLGGFAIIIGSANGIGRETAFTFAEAGVAGILFADIDEDGAKEAAEESKKFATSSSYRPVALKVDVSDVDSVQNMVDVAKKEFGRIDYSINSAGIGSDTISIIPDLNIAEFDKLHNVHTRGAMLVTRAVSKAMTQQEEKSVPHRNGSRKVGRGVILNVASAFSLIATQGLIPYISAKHAVMGIVKSAALELAGYGIRVNGICPTWVNTPMVARERKHRPEVEAMTTANPYGRPAEPDEVADAILFLCSPQATYITGSGMVVDAGLMINAPTH